MCIHKKAIIPIHGTGPQIRDYTHAEDAAATYALHAENPAAVINTFLLPIGVAMSLSELAKTILDITGSEAEIQC